MSPKRLARRLWHLRGLHSKPTNCNCMRENQNNKTTWLRCIVRKGVPVRYFRQFPPHSPTPLLTLFNQPTFLGLNKYQKDDFTSSTVTFYQKSIFSILNPFTNRLWDIFRFIFRQLRMTLFHKITVKEKNNFSSNASHNLTKYKVISNF